MSLLKKVPFWGWFLISTTLLYLLWNPAGFSLVAMWSAPDVAANLPLKVLGTLLAAVILGMFGFATWRSLRLLGIIILGSILAVVLWCLAFYGLMDPTSVGLWSWITQPLLAIILTTGFQWKKIWLGLTAIRGVEDPDTSTIAEAETEHHH